MSLRTEEVDEKQTFDTVRFALGYVRVFWTCGHIAYILSYRTHGHYTGKVYIIIYVAYLVGISR